MKEQPTLDGQLLDLASKSGKSGFSPMDLAGYPVRQIYNACQKLIRYGQLHKGKVGHRTVRMFATGDWAQAFERTRQTIESRQAGNTGIRAARATWSVNTPAIFPVDEHGKPLYKITHCPSSFDPLEAQIRNASRWNATGTLPRNFNF